MDVRGCCGEDDEDGYECLSSMSYIIQWQYSLLGVACFAPTPKLTCYFNHLAIPLLYSSQLCRADPHPSTLEIDILKNVSINITLLNPTYSSVGGL